MLVPLPGHTAGNTGMFINRSNGPRLLLLGDAAWVAANFQRPATMHPFIWNNVTSDDATARQTLIHLHHFALAHPEISLVAMHGMMLLRNTTICVYQLPCWLHLIDELH